MVLRGVLARGRLRSCLAVLAAPLALTLSVTLAPVAAALPVKRAIGVHSMLFLDHPFGAKEAMFKEAAAAGASTIRLDIELSGVFPNPAGRPDWSGVDQYMLLARRYHLQVLADLLATPWYATACPPGTPPDATYRCPPGDPALWGRDAGLIAAHTRGVIDDFEIINEPDGPWAFLGTPQQYAATLAASADQIHRANPSAHVALGGLMNLASHAWIDAMLKTPGANALHKLDIANIHVRTDAADAAGPVRRWRRYFTSKGFTGQLWVTETGYPANPSQQTDPAYTVGAQAQARYLTNTLPAMICAGAAKVFPTERDSLGGPFASEGFLQTPDPLPAFATYTRRPSFYAIRSLANGRSHAASARLARCLAGRHAKRPKHRKQHRKRPPH